MRREGRERGHYHMFFAIFYAGQLGPCPEAVLRLKLLLKYLKNKNGKGDHTHGARGAPPKKIPKCRKKGILHEIFLIFFLPLP